MKLNKKFQQGVFMALGFLMAAAAVAQGNGNAIVKPGQVLFGKSYNQLAEEWINWFVREPIATNPAFDPDGRYCGRNQDGKVWFLASTLGGVADRSCEIPSGKAIFVSLGEVFVSFSPEFPGEGDPCQQMATDLEKVRCDVNNDVPLAPNVALQASLDGVPVEDIFAYRTQSLPGGFTLRVPNGSFLTDLGLPAGDRFPTVADGYYLFLKPLAPGRHTLNLLLTYADQSVRGVNYTLTVP